MGSDMDDLSGEVPHGATGAEVEVASSEDLEDEVPAEPAPPASSRPGVPDPPPHVMLRPPEVQQFGLGLPGGFGVSYQAQSEAGSSHNLTTVLVNVLALAAGSGYAVAGLFWISSVVGSPLWVPVGGLAVLVAVGTATILSVRWSRGRRGPEGEDQATRD
ncbi:hypothetical protein [Nocardiopsis sp. NRRL B-16309]|uniref:hypothetical protein n=1 Tax=Nocardiopsis sp. NRRL B-16309 TaxID=1519494 RepID=UPI0006B059CA|nr:hypothetical protein [Nocardiopsis sp. NRRL B-16309]KOX07900.1 hypothetical protein ADL05_28370 [Nocardiopsis sp. NRRL B-16309]